MALLKIQNIGLGYGGSPLFEQVDLQVEPGERICVIGRNGAGKSTLLQILMNRVVPDEGTCYLQPGAKIADLPQEVPSHIRGRISDVIADGYGEAAAALTAFHQISRSLSAGRDPEKMAKLSRLQQTLDETDGWMMEQKVGEVITRFELQGDAVFENLSAGLKRRVLLARALVADPDLLLLDEPTNHMDIQAIDLLESYLKRFVGTVLFVTHDRMLLQNLATRIVELDRGRLFGWRCDYRTYLKRKAVDLEAEARRFAVFDKKLAQEEQWIRQGIKARRTRNEGRVRALQQMREIRKNRRTRTGTARISAQEAEQSGKLVMEAEQISYQWEGTPIIQDFSTTILRGDRVGIIGPNGIGKTTLLKILLGEIRPNSGTVRLGTKLQVAYFDQLRAGLDENKTVQENVGNGKEILTINGKSRHVIGYLQDFLFTPDRSRSPVRTLSGGERNRLLLAQIFSRQSNLLVLDEPTNDLDLETLELLEELLLDYIGTILLISHDRAFLNHVVTSTLVFEGAGQVREYVGGYDDWIAQQPVVPVREKADRRKEKPAAEKKPSRKLRYHEVRELEVLPETIETLEKKQQDLYTALSDPDFYKRDGKEIADIKKQVQVLEKDLEAAYRRWEELESRR